MIGPLSRIVLRYAIGPLLAVWLAPDVVEELLHNPDAALVVGGVLVGGVEGFYWVARRLGWAT